MNLRVARHTTDLDALISFYQDVLGLEVLGGFKDHNGYDGVFLGLEGCGWHLEFTVSDEKPDHKPDEDDLLVFYASTEKVYYQLLDKIRGKNMEEVVPKNPYWKENGITILDPDGFRLVVSFRKS